MICAKGGKGKSVYKGDSGGPLAIKGQDGKYTLIGIASSIYTYQKPSDAPNIFTRVPAFTEWIKNNKM